MAARLPSFDDYKGKSERLTLGDLKNFVVHFELPISEANYSEMVRKLLKRNSRPITYEVFKEVLIEIFFLAEAEEIYNSQDSGSLNGNDDTVMMEQPL